MAWNEEERIVRRRTIKPRDIRIGDRLLRPRFAEGERPFIVARIERAPDPARSRKKWIRITDTFFATDGREIGILPMQRVEMERRPGTAVVG